MAEEKVVPRIQELNRYSMFTNAPGAEGKRSRLAFSIRDNNPRITVYTNVPTDTVSYGIIAAPMNPETFFVMLDLLKKIAVGENGNKHKIDCFTQYKDKEGKLQDRTLLSEVLIGKDDNGIVWISVVSGSRPKIKFEFRISDFHKLYKADGHQFSESESSVLEALAKVKALESIYYRLTGDLRPNNNTGTFTPKTQSNESKQSTTSIELDDITF